LSVAASTLDLLRHYFPNQIDNLPREAGTVVGPKPVIVTSESSISTFLSGGRESDEPIDFGAGQVILVRNHQDIVQLKEKLNMQYVLILTVEQAKGIAYLFFKSRLIYYNERNGVQRRCTLQSV
jgi:hypothetical protein